MFPIYLMYISSINFPNEMRENYIRNTCSFDIVRIKKNNIKCFDYGYYSSYCNHYSLPSEFVIRKEKSLGNKYVYTIKPEAIYEKTNYNKIKIADFYYNFYCDNSDNQAKLYLTIVPVYEASFLGLILIIIFVFIMCFIIVLCENNNNSNDNSFSNGLIIGNLLNTNQKREIYSE